MTAPKTTSEKRSKSRYLLHFATLFCCTCMLTSCSMVGSLLNYVVSLPFKLINAVCP